KYLLCIAGLLLFRTLLPAESTAADRKQEAAAGTRCTWGLLWAGSWEENKTLHNRAEVRLGFPAPSLTLRAQAVDRRIMDFTLENPWGGPADRITNFSAGLYHRPTGSRLLYGPLDEWGLPARIRSPWIRSAPFAENHKPVMADIKTAVSAAKTPEVYLYLSSPRFALFPGLVKQEITMKSFASAQMRTAEVMAPAFSGGLETLFGKKSNLLLEGFYTGAELPARNSTAWFAVPPPLPARDFRLGAAGMLLNTPLFSLASDWAYSETFAFGRDLYGNAGLKTGPFPAGSGKWSVALAADGAGEHFTGRDGGNPGAGFRTAGKFEWKGLRSSLFRASAVFRGPGIGETFDHGSMGLYCRFPAPVPAGRRTDKNGGRTAGPAPFPLRITRVSLNASRNAAAPEKIIDGIDGSLGLSLNLPLVLLPGFSTGTGARATGSPLAINISGSVKGSASEEAPLPFPVPQEQWEFDSAKAGCELVWSPGIFQFRTKWGYEAAARKEGKWDASVSALARIGPGRFSIKAASPGFPQKWNCTVSWRLEKK
ncbi:MAG: hypothetical protein LBD48_15185, partial [Treponema sp.]|nr:hypothetical protein [Treponema sp.]